MHFPEFSNKDTNVISQLFENGKITSWVNVYAKIIISKGTRILSLDGNIF